MDRDRSGMLREEMMLAKLARLLGPPLLRLVPQRRWYSTLEMVLSQAPERLKLQQGVLSMWGSLENLKANEFSPRVVIDVGAWIGAWTEHVHAIFPDAQYLMVEANPGKRAGLEAVAERLGPSVRLCMALLGRESREEVTFFAMEAGSSVLAENTGFDRQQLALPMTTLDEVSGGATLEGPVLLKLDVQGYELEVLRGGAQTLARSDVVLLEVSLLEYNQGAPLMSEVVAFMNASGFVPYDVCGQLRRETDAALCQIDIMFVRRESALRAKKLFWNRDPGSPAQGTPA
jgi:FkbM family methyltransferase